jgi:zinc protease
MKTCTRAPYGRTVDGTPTRSPSSPGRPVAQHHATFARDNLIVGVSQYQREELAPLLDVAFGDLPEGGADGDRRGAPHGRRGFVQRMSIPQSVVMFGHGAEARRQEFCRDGDEPSGGGTFSSRLYTEVREKRGLAYSVYSFLNPFEKGPLYMGQVSTENARVKESIDIIRAEWKRMAGGEVTAEEVDSAKTYITGSYALRFASASDISRMLVNTIVPLLKNG